MLVAPPTNNHLLCVYFAVRQKRPTVFAATASSSRTSHLSSSSLLAPYIGCAIAEYLRDSAKHAVTHDDMSKQAVAYPR